MAKTRRGRGEGGIRQRKDGTWEVRVSKGVAPDGKRRRYSAYSKTKSEALAELHRLQTEGQKRSGSPTVAEYLKNWLRDVVTPTSEAATLQTYDAVIRAHIVPALGKVKISKLAPGQIQAFYAELSRAGTSKGTSDKIHAVLRRALEHAVDLEIIPRNPAAKVKRPKGQVAERGVLSAEDIDAYIRGVLQERLAALFIMALFTTMREGEILGLQWTDVDLGARAISVRHAWKKLRGPIINGKQTYTYGLGQAKTPRSRRRILLPDIVMDALQAHRKRMMSEKHGSKFVFVGTRGKPIGPANLRNRLHYRILASAGLPRVTFHDLRHSAATVLLELNVHPKIVQERLGHSTSRMTLDRYSHALPTMQEAAVNAINARFGTLEKYRE